jgi:hypothetical protein
MNRRDQLFNAKPANGGDASLASTRVRFQFGRSDPARKKGELRQLSPEEKAMCALRKVFAKMSAETLGKQRFSVVGDQWRVLERHVFPGAKSGDPGSYRFRGRCLMAIAHTDGDSLKMVEFEVSFRDVENDLGLADVEYIDPTTVDEIDPRASL